MRSRQKLYCVGRQSGRRIGGGGKAEIGINLIEELLPNSEIQVIGPLQGDLQLTLSFAAVILSGTHELDASKALIAFLRTTEVAVLIKGKGMEPN